MLQPLMVEPLLLHSIRIIISAMTAGAETEKGRARIADIVVAVGGMQIDRIAFSCTFGFPHSALFDMAKLTCPSCLFFTLLGEDFPILGIPLSPFRFHP